ncbi:MAG: hypothetical protein ACRDSH_06660 [Pseudonocardiaceae bacterium]
MRPFPGIRRRISHRIARLIDYRIDQRVPPEQLAGYPRRLADLDHRVGQRLAELEHRLDGLRGELDSMRNELDRIIPHVASQESALQALRDQLDTVPAADSAQIHQARSLIDEIRREHAQIRVRLSGIAHYEVRLRRLEDLSIPSAGPSGTEERPDGVDDPVDVAPSQVSEQR